MPYAQACVTIEGDTLTLISYTTPILRVDAEGWLMAIGPVTYSNTTRRHVGCFMHDYGYGTYQLAKLLYENRLKYNSFTGEIIER
jgi:hypothetical protein